MTPDEQTIIELTREVQSLKKRVDELESDRLRALIAMRKVGVPAFFEDGNDRDSRCQLCGASTSAGEITHRPNCPFMLAKALSQQPNQTGGEPCATNQQGEHTTNASLLVASKGADADVPPVPYSAEVCPTCGKTYQPDVPCSFHAGMEEYKLMQLASDPMVVECEQAIWASGTTGGAIREIIASLLHAKTEEKDREIERLRQTLEEHAKGNVEFIAVPSGILAERAAALRAQQQAEERLSLAEQERDEARKALAKVPVFRMTEDALGWECCGCGAVSGIDEHGGKIEQPCKPGCYVPFVEQALQPQAAPGDGEAGR